MKYYRGTLIEAASSLVRNRELIYSLSKREVLGRYKGSMLGLVWSIATPLAMIAVYTFVFNTIFKARWGTVENETKLDFALLLFAGLIAFNLLSECLSRAPSIILSNANYVKKVVFPLEILPVISLATALFHGATSLAAWILIHLIFKGVPPATAFLAPLALLPLALQLLGASWFLSAIGVYVRDTPQVINPAITVVMFLSPIFYPASAIPQAAQWLFSINPLTETIETLRNTLFWGVPLDPRKYTLSLFLGLAIASAGFYTFQKIRRGFGDVI